MRNYFAYSKQENLASYRKELSHKPYYDMMRGFFIFANIILLGCQAVSGYSEYVYFTTFYINLSGYWLMAASALTALTIEGFKYFLFYVFFSQFYNVQGKSYFNAFAFFFALLVSGLSISTSIVGGGKLGIDTGKVISTESKHDSEIAALRTEIKEIQKRNTWKGNVWLPAKDKALLHTKESELSKAKTTKESDLQAVEAKNQEQETSYRYGFGAFEALYILLTIFTFYYKKRSSIEELDEPQTIESSHSPTPKKTFLPAKAGYRGKRVQNFNNFQVKQHTEKDEQPNEQQVKQPFEQVASIEEEVTQQDKQQVKQPFSKTIECENPNCKKVFTTSNKNQIYCDDDCRRKFNEEKILRKQFKLWEGGNKA